MKLLRVVRDTPVSLAMAASDAPPDLTDVVDADTGKPLVWRGKPVT